MPGCRSRMRSTTSARVVAFRELLGAASTQGDAVEVVGTGLGRQHHGRQRLDRIAAGPHYHDVPDPSAVLPAAKGRHEPGSDHRGLPRPRRTNDCEQRLAGDALEQRDRVGLSTAEELGILLAERVKSAIGADGGVQFVGLARRPGWLAPHRPGEQVHAELEVRA